MLGTAYIWDLGFHLLSLLADLALVFAFAWRRRREESEQLPLSILHHSLLDSCFYPDTAQDIHGLLSVSIQLVSFTSFTCIGVGDYAFFSGLGGILKGRFQGDWEWQTWRFFIIHFPCKTERLRHVVWCVQSLYLLSFMLRYYPWTRFCVCLLQC